MAAFDLNALSENASRLGMRLQETLSEHTRDFTRGSNPSLLDTLDEKQLRKQLDSNSDREKLDAMKRLIGLISRGRNVSEFFAQVVKNVASQNLEVRKLVYIYLLRYAEAEPDLALLSINTFQKDLADPSPLIRAMALRVLAGIRVPMIASLIVLAIRKCAADISPYVRKAAALAIPKCFQLDPARQGELIEILTGLLRDRSPLSLGAVLAAFSTVCPTRLDLIHSHFRRLCRTLIDVDEWGQIDVLSVLARYARTMLPRPLSDEPGEVDLDRDLRLLLTSAEPLLMSDNAAVVLAVARTLYFLAPPQEWSKIVQPLLRLLHGDVAMERAVLSHLLAIAPSLTEELTPLWPCFLIRTDDIGEVKKDKVRLLRRMLSPDNYQALLREFIVYADDTDDTLVAEAITAIGHCARLFPESTTQCVTSLMTFIRFKNDVVVTNAVLVLQSLIRTRLPTPASAAHGGPAEILARLARRIADIHHPAARACVFWLAGQYAADTDPAALDEAERLKLPEELRGMRPWAPDLLRIAAKGFAQEASVTKLQILTLAAKLLALAPTHTTVALLARYTFSQARYDTNVDVRDRARMLGALLAGVSAAARGDDMEESGGVVLRQAQVKMVLFEGKSGTGLGSLDQDVDASAFGTLAAVTGKQTLHSDTYLPDWLEKGIDPALRDSPDDAPPVRAQVIPSPAIRSIGSAPGTPVALVSPGAGASPSGSFTQNAKGTWTDLDQFYEDTAEDEVKEESEDETDEESEEVTETEGSSEDGNDEDRGA